MKNSKKKNVWKAEYVLRNAREGQSSVWTESTFTESTFARAYERAQSIAKRIGFGVKLKSLSATQTLSD